ncbi:DUF1983 domain-containing protein [Ignatzschineria indica]|uniref:phage tail protein n=1 Tax=Ignatzschineria indica TaxID=472583 RepID=UPI002574A0AD|nr:phage tail protein [Ignatzschineria indica]MDM1545499.1 DUF1983 domain-containing protein [Ignatzschineria indica]
MGGKKKGGSAHTPYEAPNTLYSKQIVKILDVLSEGPVEGLANGDTHPFKSTFFNDTPVQSENGDFNFKGFELAINDGDQDQVYLPEFDVVEKTNQVNADVKQDTPITRTVTDPYVSSVRVTVGVKGLVEMKDNGDRLPTSVTMTVSILKAGNYHASKVVTIHEKGTETYYQDVTFNDLPEAPFDIRVARVTPDSKTDKIQNATIFPSFVETIDAKLSYPFLAMAGYKFDAMQFGSSLPRINTLLKGRIVQIPTNYDPINRTYTGMWDGSFKLGWTDNPAWIIYDFITNERYGGKIDPRYVDRAALYRVSQFCDELVDDGYGGKEPRVTFNAYYTDDKKFRDRLQDMCSAFFGHAIWNGKYLSFTLDNDEDPVALYTNANVVDGNFSYEGISNSAVITTVHVQYIDKNDAYRQKTEVVEDRDLLRRYRTNVQKVVAEGCTSRSQAHRLGRYILEKSRLRQTISFRIGAEGLKHRPFDVIQIADNHLAGTNIGGRVMAIEGKTVTLDREVENANKGTFSYLGVDEGKLKKIDLEITEQIDSKKLRLKEIPEDLRKFSAWSLSRSDVKPKYYRALGISQGNDGTFSIKAIEHEVGLQDRLASGLKFEEDPNSIWSSFPEITNNTIGNDGDTVVINWENINSDTTALTYIVKLYKDGKLYRKYEDLAEPNLRFEGLPDGEYVVEIQARNSRGQLSNTLKDYFSLNYTITEVTADPDFWAVKLNWKLPTIVNVDVSTEVWRSETEDFNDARLRVTLPYPTSTHKDEGMSIGDQYYYFLRIIDKTGKTGELVGPISGQPKQANEGKELLGYLQDQITTKEISPDAVDEIIKKAKESIDFDEIFTQEDIDQIIENVLEGVKDGVDEVIAESDVIKEVSERVDNAELEAQLLELSKVTADRAVYGETQVNRVSIDDAFAEMILQYLAEVTNDKQLAQQYLSLVAENEIAKAELILSQLATTTETRAIAQEILSLSASFLDTKANIENLKEVVAEEDYALAQSIEKLRVEVDENISSEIVNINKVIAENEKTTSESIKNLQSEVDENIKSEIDGINRTIAEKEKATAQSIENLNSAVGKNSSEISNVKQSVSTLESSTATQINSLKTDVGKNSSEIDSVKRTQASDKQALANDISRVQASVNDTNAKVTQNSTAIASVDGTVKSQYTLTTEATVNGQKVVSGFTSVNDGKTSEFLIQADKLAVVNMRNGEVVMPFIIANGKLVMDGDMIATGSISGNKLVAGTSIQAPIMKGGRVESGHFAGGSINIGNGNFTVDSNGNLYAKSGKFEGTVYAEKIEGDVVTISTFERKNEASDIQFVITPERFDRFMIMEDIVLYDVRWPGYGGPGKDVMTIMYINGSEVWRRNTVGDRTIPKIQRRIPANQTTTVKITARGGWENNQYRDSWVKVKNGIVTIAKTKTL